MEDEYFKNLPTETLKLDKNFNLLKKTRIAIEKEYDEYYLATCHYVIRNNEKQYYLAPHQIKKLLTMVRDDDPDYPHYVKEVLYYGRDLREIQEEQNKKKSK